MKKNLTERVFILNCSGSTAGLEKDTIGGFNAMIEKQRCEAGEEYMSIGLFGNGSEIFQERIALSRVPGAGYGGRFCRQPQPYSSSTKAEVKACTEENFCYDLSRTCEEICPGYFYAESCRGTVPEVITAFPEDRKEACRKGLPGDRPEVRRHIAPQGKLKMLRRSQASPEHYCLAGCLRWGTQPGVLFENMIKPGNTSSFAYKVLAIS